MKGDEVSVQKVVRLLGNRKKVIIGVTLACGLIAVVMSFFLEKVYQSSTIIQVGSIYSPSDPTRQIIAELIENPALLAEAINEGSFVSDTLKKMGDTNFEKYFDVEIKAESFEYGRGRDVLPMVVIYKESPDPGQIVEFLQNMAAIIIERSREKYEANRVALEDSIKNAEEKIINISNVIAIKQRMRETFNEYLDQEKQKVENYEREFKKINSDQINPVELLFLQSSTMNISKMIEDIGQIESDLMASIEENQALIGEYRDMMAIFKLRLALSTPTQVIQEPVLPIEPIRPKRALIVVIASLLGLIFSSSLIFIRYILTV